MRIALQNLLLEVKLDIGRGFLQVNYQYNIQGLLNVFHASLVSLIDKQSHEGVPEINEKYLYN